MRKIAKNCVCFSESLNFKIALKSVQEITSKSPPKISNICFEKLCLHRKGATILKNYTFKTPQPLDLQTFPRPCFLIKSGRCIRSNASPMEENLYALT